MEPSIQFILQPALQQLSVGYPASSILRGPDFCLCLQFRLESYTVCNNLESDSNGKLELYSLVTRELICSWLLKEWRRCGVQ